MSWTAWHTPLEGAFDCKELGACEDLSLCFNCLLSFWGEWYFKTQDSNSEILLLNTSQLPPLGFYRNLYSNAPMSAYSRITSSSFHKLISASELPCKGVGVGILPRCFPLIYPLKLLLLIPHWTQKHFWPTAPTIEKFPTSTPRPQLTEEMVCVPQN